MAINKGIDEAAMCPNLCFILTINFRAHCPLLEFHFLGFLQRVLADGGRFEGQNGDSEKTEFQGIHGTLLNSWVKEARNYSSYELALCYEFSKVFSMVHPPALSLLLYIALLSIGVLIGKGGTWRPDWPRVCEGRWRAHDKT